MTWGKGGYSRAASRLFLRGSGTGRGTYLLYLSLFVKPYTSLSVSPGSVPLRFVHHWVRSLKIRRSERLVK